MGGRRASNDYVVLDILIFVVAKVWVATSGLLRERNRYVKTKRNGAGHTPAELRALATRHIFYTN